MHIDSKRNEMIQTLEIPIDDYGDNSIINEKHH